MNDVLSEKNTVALQNLMKQKSYDKEIHCFKPEKDSNSNACCSFGAPAEKFINFDKMPGIRIFELNEEVKDDNLDISTTSIAKKRNQT